MTEVCNETRHPNRRIQHELGGDRTAHGPNP